MFAERLKELRKMRRFSQHALAERLGISQQAVGKWETGKSTPDPATLREIADIFEVSVDLLLGRELIPPSWGLSARAMGRLLFRSTAGRNPPACIIRRNISIWW